MAYTNIDDPSAFFQTATYTGNAGTLAVVNDGNSDLQPDWVWCERRDVGANHVLYDSSRGASKVIYSNLTEDEETVSGVTAFNTDGFTLGSDGNANASSGSQVAWQWKANGGTTSSNTDGSVTSTVQVNQDAGFSIVTWTTGVGAGNHSVGHGLGVKPAMFITKSRGGTSSWWTWHQGLAGDTSYVNLSSNTAKATFSDIWGDGITSSVFGYNYPATVNANQTYIAYCFAEKQGYSKFGSYVGNGGTGGNNVFVYTGFKPAFIMIKNADAAGHWAMQDYKRNGYNGQTQRVWANRTNSESGAALDLLSNGFKITSTAGGYGASGNKYIYMAFAENPFVTSTGIPTTAR